MIKSIEAQADKDYEAMISPMPKVIVTSLLDDPSYTKCPRCWHYHTILINHDKLCDRCCRVLIENYADHPSVPFILENLEAQRKQFSASADKQ